MDRFICNITDKVQIAICQFYVSEISFQVDNAFEALLQSMADALLWAEETPIWHDSTCT
jgi:hypothetical protein